MPHVAQFGQSPFLQGLSSVAAAAAAAKSIEKKTEWRAFMGNSAASSSSNSYHGSRNFGNFGICVQNVETLEMIRGARVQCWDNDNNGFGQEIGEKGVTNDKHGGCYQVYYNAKRSWDWGWGNAKRPDIYCKVNYKNKNWRFDRPNANGNFFIETLPYREKCPIFTKDPKNDDDLQKYMLESTKECGYYEKQDCGYTVIPANLVHPGEGPGDLENKPYIVQFDIGIHPELEDLVGKEHKNYQHKHKRERLTKDNNGKNIEGEKCLEIIVEGGSDATGGCAGKCGGGCTLLKGGGYAKDCMKHDVCATYKAMSQSTTNGYAFSKEDGFCYDPDCGDEAASTIFNCFNDDYLFDTPITCEKSNFDRYKNAYGHWSHATKAFDEGPCENFIGWKNGQGIPDKNEIYNPY